MCPRNHRQATPSFRSGPRTRQRRAQHNTVTMGYPARQVVSPNITSGTVSRSCRQTVPLNYLFSPRLFLMTLRFLQRFLMIQVYHYQATYHQLLQSKSRMAIALQSFLFILVQVNFLPKQVQLLFRRNHPQRLQILLWTFPHHHLHLLPPLKPPTLLG